MNPDPFNHHDDSHEDVHALCADDCEALQALCDAGFDCERVPASMRERSLRVAALLGVLNAATETPTDSLLIDATCAQVARARRQSDLELSPRDDDALEALVCAGMDPARCPSGVRARAERHAALLSLLDVRVDDAERTRLVASTLTHIQSSVDDQAVRMQLAERPARVAFKPRWADLMTVAALMLISFGVLTPMLGAMRSGAQKTACAGNMATAGAAFGQYAQSNRDALPLATASPAGTQWWDVGNPAKSNSANQYRIIATGYARMETLVCKGNTAASRAALSSAPDAADWKSIDQVSYSYQNLFAPVRPNWTSPSSQVVLADRSPVVLRAIRGEWIRPTENSPNHGGDGQTVLMTDGSGPWLRTPVLKSGDNIWLPRPIEDAIARLQDPSRAAPLQGTEAPMGKDDVFLGP